MIDDIDAQVERLKSLRQVELDRLKAQKDSLQALKGIVTQAVDDALVALSEAGIKLDK